MFEHWLIRPWVKKAIIALYHNIICTETSGRSILVYLIPPLQILGKDLFPATLPPGSTPMMADTSSQLLNCLGGDGYCYCYYALSTVFDHRRPRRFPPPRGINAPTEWLALRIGYRRLGLKKLEWWGYLAERSLTITSAVWIQIQYTNVTDGHRPTAMTALTHSVAQ